jgi:hypothetical protein
MENKKKYSFLIENHGKLNNNEHEKMKFPKWTRRNKNNKENIYIARKLMHHLCPKF